MSKIVTLFLFISVFFQEMSSQYIKMNFPLKFKNIKILYTSKFEIYYDYKIIVDYPNEILFWDQKDSNIKKLDYKGFQIEYFNFYRNIETVIRSNMKPQDYQITNLGINYYFSRYCDLYLYNYYDEPKWQHFSHKRYFENLENYDEGNCVLEMAFNEYKKDEIAVYNLNNKKIIVINLADEIRDKPENEAIQVSMNNYIAQVLIHSDEEGNTILIGIDINGAITFWGLHGIFYNYWIINTFEFDMPPNYLIQTAGIIGDKEKALLYINNDDFILFDLKEIKIINKQTNLISKASTLLIIDNGQGLVGTINGFIYLIQLFNNRIIVLDRYELCKGKLISIISYNTTCPKGHEICYIFAANCGYENGYMQIFQIQNERINDF